MTKAAMPKTSKSTWQRVKTYMSYANQLYPHIISLQFFSAVTQVIANFINVALLAFLINRIMQRQVSLKTVLWQLGGFLISLFLVMTVNRYLTVQTQAGSKLLNARARGNLAKRLLAVDYSTFSDPEFRKLYSATRTGFTYTGGFTLFVSRVVNQIVNFTATLVLSGGVMAYILTAKGQSGDTGQLANSWWFTGLILVMVCFPIVSASRLAKTSGRIMTHFFDFNIQFNRTLDYFSEVIFKNLAVGKLLRIYDPQHTLVRSVWTTVNKQMKQDTKLQLQVTAIDGITDIITAAIVGLLYATLSLKWLSGAISLGLVVAGVGYLQQTIQALAALFEAWGSRSASFATMDQYIKFMTDSPTHPTVKQRQILPEVTRNHLTITFHDVSFHYPNQKTLAVQHLNLTLSGNDQIAIVGPNGSGKTTLVKLLVRLEVPTSGMITLNGVDIQRLDLKTYQQLLSVVFQDYRLFPFSIQENVTAFDKPGGGKLTQALQKAGMWQRVSQMPDGVATKLFEQFDHDGAYLSGGESQKVAIARAWYRDAPIVVLDEPTAALDPVSELEIYDQFQKLATNKLAVFISHRMSSTKFAKRVLVFDRGRLVEYGQHQTLMAQHGLYYDLFMAQAKYYQ